MANKKYKLDGNDYWEASGVYDIGQGDTQRSINDEVVTKLATIDEGAEVNQNAFSNVTVGGTTIAADSKTDTLTLTAGSNITLTPNATNDSVTIAAEDTTYDNATQSAAGLMSAADKTKLDTLDSADIADNSTVGGSTVEASLTSLKGSLNSEVTARKNADTAIQGAIASVETNWQSASKTFAVGEYIYSTTSGELYKITTAVPQGTSFEGHVTLTTIGDVLSSELIDISENITLTIQNVSHTLYCRRWGKNVWLNIFTPTPQTLTVESGWVSVGTLSPNYCPPTNLLINTRFNDTNVQIRIQTNGAISFAGIPAITNAYIIFAVNYIVN